MDPSLSVWVHDVDPSIAPGLPALLGERARVGSTIYFKIGPLDTDWALSPGGGGIPSAPSNATYWVSTANASLTAEVNMGALASGILQHTVALGVSTPGVVTIGSGLSYVGTTLSAPGLSAQFWVSTANADLASEVNLGAVAAGILGHTVALGVSTPIRIVESTGLTLTSPNLTVNLSTGIAGGQSVIGGTAASESLTYSSTTNATKGRHIFGSTGGMVFNESSNVLSIGDTSPPGFASLAFEYYRSANDGVLFFFVNDNAGANAYSSFTLSTHRFFATSYYQMSLFGTGSTRGYPYTAGTGVMEVAGGSGSMVFWLNQASGSIIWNTGTTYPNPTEVMKLTNAGVLSVNNLGAAGTGRLVKAAATTGILSIASASDVAGAITWPAGNRVLYTDSAAGPPLGTDGVLIDLANDALFIAVGGVQVWRNLGVIGAGTYEHVRAYWDTNQWTLASESAGGTVRNMVIQADTATLTLSAGGGATMVGGVVGSAPSITAANTQIEFSPIVSRARSAGATLDAVLIDGETIQITGAAGTNITTATGFNYVGIEAPTYDGGGNATTISTAATVAIYGPPTGVDSATITNAYALLVFGRTEITGDTVVNGSGATLGFFGSLGTTRQTSGANLTNNVTSGGTNDQIDNWTDLTTYATDAAAIRNAIYQLARKLKQINDGARAYNLFT